MCACRCTAASILTSVSEQPLDHSFCSLRVIIDKSLLGLDVCSGDLDHKSERWAGLDVGTRSRSKNMAENPCPALKKISEQLTCPVCLEAYKKPKVLDCHHVFCCKCLEGLTRRDDSVALICPTCRHETLVPERSIDGLKSAFHIQSLFDIQETLLEQRKPSTPTNSQSSTGEYCSNHPHRVLEMFCDMCMRPICCACIVDDHKSHSFSLIADTVREQKHTLSLQSKMLEQQLQVSQRLLENISLNVEQVKQNRTAVEEKIQRNFELFHKILDVRQRELNDNLSNLTQHKLEALAVKTSTLETVEAKAKGMLGSAKVILDSENVTDILTAKKRLADVLQQTSTETIVLSSDPELLVKADLGFFYGLSNFESLSTVGELYTQVPCARNSVLQVVDETTCVRLGNTLSLLLHIKDQHGACVKSDFKDMKCEMLPFGLVNCFPFVSMNLSKCSDGCYKVSNTPTVRGRHRLEITMNDEHVVGSPCQITVCPPPTVYSVPLRCVKNLNAPWGVAISSMDRVIITENKSHSLLVFGQEADKIVRSVGKSILSDIFQQQPSDVFIDGDDQLYISEQHTFAIKKCDMDGNVLKSVGSPGDTSLRFMSPMGMCINPQNGRLYVADMQNHRIQVLNSDLTFHSFIVSSTDGKHTVRLPSDIAFDQSGTMYVTDNESHCVNVYSFNCEYLRAIGKKGKKEGQLGLPFGICLDEKGHIFVAEVFNDRVSIFKTCGDFVRCFGSHGTNPGQFNRPHKVTIDKAGYLYVTDTGNNRLQVF